MLPVTQAEIWKALGISSKDGSELIGYLYLLDEKIISEPDCMRLTEWLVT